jgi:hypothetical protein
MKQREYNVWKTPKGFLITIDSREYQDVINKAKGDHPEMFNYAYLLDTMYGIKFVDLIMN